MKCFSNNVREKQMKMTIADNVEKRKVYLESLTEGERDAFLQKEKADFAKLSKRAQRILTVGGLFKNDG